MGYPDGSNPEELGDVRDSFVWMFIIGAVLTAVGVLAAAELFAIDQLQIIDIPDSIIAKSLAVGVLGFAVIGLSILLMRIIPPPNPY